MISEIKKKPKTLAIMLVLVLAVLFTFQINPVLADVPEVISVEHYTVGNNTFLNITIYHDSPGPDNYVSLVEIKIDSNVEERTLRMQTKWTFSIQYNMSEVTDAPVIQARALCDRHGWSSWSQPVVIPAPGAVIKSCNSAGARKDLFDLGETVYVNGSKWTENTTYSFYIVVDEETWSEGMAIPERVPDTATNVSANIDGDIPPTAVWSNLQTEGKFDIVLDVNGNGLYDAEIDFLDDSDIEVTAGFSVIPEFSSSLILLLFVTATLISVIIRRRR